MKSLAILLGIVIVMAVLFVPRYLVLESEQKKIERAAQASPPIAVKVMQLKANKKPIELQLPSYLDAIDATPILARTNGYLKRFLVDIGDKVKQGQLLAEIDTPEVDEEVIRAEGELASFIAKEEIAAITAKRWTDLYAANPEALSKEEVDQNIAAYESASANVVAAKANLDRLKFLQGYKYVYAPYDGLITTRNIDIGSLIIAGSFDIPTTLYEIARTDILRAFVDVPQSHFYLIKDGLEAAAYVWQYPGKAFKGIIDRNASALDPHARTLLTQVNIDNTNGALMPGLYAAVSFSFPPKEKSFIIPVGALIIRSGPPYVAIVGDDHTVHLQQVTIGRDFGKTIEIIDGLSEDEEIITNPTDSVKEKSRVVATPLTKEEQASLL